jgi:hypothetical protein
MVGQNAVFDRAEQRSDHAETGQSNEQNNQRMGHEADHRHRGDGDLDELQALRHDRLVVSVGDLAAERGEEEVRRDEDRAGKRDQRLAFRSDMEQDQEYDRVFQEVVVKGGKELTPEQRREAPGQHQWLRRFGHTRQSSDIV